MRSRSRAGNLSSLTRKKLEDLGITRRELETLELIAQGMSNRQIAEKLYVSESTIKTHSSRVFDKLGAKRRTKRCNSVRNSACSVELLTRTNDFLVRSENH